MEYVHDRELNADETSYNICNFNFISFHINFGLIVLIAHFRSHLRASKLLQDLYCTKFRLMLSLLIPFCFLLPSWKIELMFMWTRYEFNWQHNLIIETFFLDNTTLNCISTDISRHHFTTRGHFFYSHYGKEGTNN